LSFDAKPGQSIRVDADIDLYADHLRHFFGEVFWNHLAGVKTSPYRVYQVLLAKGILPEYSLAPKVSDQVSSLDRA
jgi:hypothetical protein